MDKPTPREVALLPCPFCGCPAGLRKTHGGQKVHVECLSRLCGVKGLSAGFEEGAASMWNTRAILQEREQ